MQPYISVSASRKVDTVPAATEALHNMHGPELPQCTLFTVQTKLLVWFQLWLIVPSPQTPFTLRETVLPLLLLQELISQSQSFGPLSEGW